jgi:hypothetical protein
MHTFYALKLGWVLAIFAFLDIVCTGVGMGVPFFCILLGLPVGWYIVKRITIHPLSTREILRQILLGALLTSAFTLALMALVWGSSIGMLFDPAADLANFGIPLILYEPLASFVGWLVLMIVISPALQFLLTLLGAHLTWLHGLSRS